MNKFKFVIELMHYDYIIRRGFLLLCGIVNVSRVDDMGRVGITLCILSNRFLFLIKI